MRICLFHPKRLPPRDYGGVERVVLWLAAGLLERGHEVTVAALEGSRLPKGAKLLPMDPARTSAHELSRLLPGGVELVHFMAPPEAGALEALPCAGLLTVHGNGKPRERFPVDTVFLSADHARRHGAEAYVHNGVDPAEFSFDPRAAKERWALFLSKTSWRVKNVGGAMELCRRARVPLVLSGGSRPWDARLRAAITPGQRWEGPVSGARKAELLARARALVFPVLWSEPFGLVVVEALMSGTPVIASRLGSLPELIAPEVGALLEAPASEQAREAWVELLAGRLGAGRTPWDPEACRGWAEARFTHLKMAEAYESAYKKVVRGERLNGRAPETQPLD